MGFRLDILKTSYDHLTIILKVGGRTNGATSFVRPTLARHDISATQDPLLQLLQNDVWHFCILKIGQTMNETGAMIHCFSPACLRVGFLKRIQMFGTLELPSNTYVPPSFEWIIPLQCTMHQPLKILLFKHFHTYIVIYQATKMTNTI